MQFTKTRDIAPKRDVSTRLQRRPSFRSGLAAALIIGALLVLFGTALGPVFLRYLPYVIVPVVGLAFLAADRGARTIVAVAWTCGMSLAAIGIIGRYPSIQIVAIPIPTFALLAAALVLGIAGVRRSRALARRASPVIAFLAIVAILWTPLAAGVQQARKVWQEQVADRQSHGALHAGVSSDYGTDYLGTMQLLKEKTPENAVIALPDQNTFPVDGNPELANYFAYPRVIKSQNVSRTPVFDISGASYIVSLAQRNRNVWPVFAVPVRMYYHTPVRHEITFGTITIHAAGQTTTIAPSALQAWQTDADRTLEGDSAEEGGMRTLSLRVTGSATDPWMAPVNLPLARDMALSAPIQTNAGTSPFLDEQVALLVEVQGPGGETALFTSRPAPLFAPPTTLTLPDLAQRAGEYARARGWHPGPLTITRVGLDLGWQLPLSQTKTNTLVMIETGTTPLPNGPDSFARLAHDAQRQLLAGNASAAVDLYGASLLLRPDNLDGQLALGAAFRAAGRWQESARFFTALLDDYPNDPWIRYSLAVAQRELGDRMAARLTIAPMVSGTPVVRITRSGAAPGSRARITATQASALSASGFGTAVTLQYDTGDRSVGEVYASVNDGRETLEMSGASGTRNVPQTKVGPITTYRLYAGTAHTTVIDSVTIEDLAPTVPARYTPWTYMFSAQLAGEMGDTAAARAAYEAIARGFPTPFATMARDAIARLDKEN